MAAYDNDYINGYIEQTDAGAFKGRISIDGVSLGAIVGQYFKKDDETYLWLRRNRVLEYDAERECYKERDARPYWETYLKKGIENDICAYRGEFIFLHFRYSIVGVFDKVLGTDKLKRLNLYVERLPMSEQTIINKIKESKQNGCQ